MKPLYWVAKASDEAAGLWGRAWPVWDRAARTRHWSTIDDFAVHVFAIQVREDERGVQVAANPEFQRECEAIQALNGEEACDAVVLRNSLGQPLPGRWVLAAVSTG